MICTLSSAHGLQASKLPALRCFESIWKDWDKCAYQYNTIQYKATLEVRLQAWYASVLTATLEDLKKKRKKKKRKAVTDSLWFCSYEPVNTTICVCVWCVRACVRAACVYMHACVCVCVSLPLDSWFCCCKWISRCLCAASEWPAVQDWKLCQRQHNLGGRPQVQRKGK